MILFSTFLNWEAKGRWETLRSWHMGCQIIAQLPCTISLVKFKHFQSNIQFKSIGVVWNVKNDRDIKKMKKKKQLMA